jgi:RNA polymerase sigma factor (sigma-70 family)
MKLDQQLMDEYNYLVTRIANDYNRKYKMVSRDDIKQELWLWFIEHPHKVKQWTEMEDQKETTKLFARSLRNAAHDYCQKEKAHSAGFNIEDNFYYQRDMVEVLLPSVLTGDKTMGTSADLNNNITGTRAPAEGGNWMVYLIDIETAFNKIPEQYQNVLHLRYAENLLGNDLSSVLNCSPDAARKRVDKALRKLIQELGGFRPYKEHDTKAPETEVD